MDDIDGYEELKYEYSDSEAEAEGVEAEDFIDFQDEAGLAEKKLWLFKENIRLENLRKSLLKEREALDEERELLAKTLKDERRRLTLFQANLDREQKLIEEKWKIIKRGFDELNHDKKEFEKKQKYLEKQRLMMREEEKESDSMFFRGVRDMLSLKKRYKDLLKIYHPDNIAGDKNTVLAINREYEEMKLRL